MHYLVTHDLVGKVSISLYYAYQVLFTSGCGFLIPASYSG